jgi:hypothetical protein
MHNTRKDTDPVDLAYQQSSRAWSLLRILASQFSAETGKFEGVVDDALELIYTMMDLIAEANEAADQAIEMERQRLKIAA